MICLFISTGNLDVPGIIIYPEPVFNVSIITFLYDVGIGWKHQLFNRVTQHYDCPQSWKEVMPKYLKLNSALFVNQECQGQMKQYTEELLL